MEPQISESSCWPSFNPSAFAPSPYTFLPATNHHQNPLIADFDQSIESAFSRFGISSDVRFASQMAMFRGIQTAFDEGGAASSVSAPPPMAYGGSQHAPNWALQGPSVNGPFGLHGALREINAGPDFSGSGPYLHAGDHNQLIKYSLRQDFYGSADTHNLDYNILHGKGYFPRNARHNVSVLPFSRNNHSLSSANSLYADQHLYKLEQHLTTENMIGNIASFAKTPVLSNALVSKLEEGLGDNEIEMILVEVMESWNDLLRNQSGSQFVQKLFTVCNEDQRTRIIEALTESPFMLISICLNSSGAKAIQKLLERLNTLEQISLVMNSLLLGAFALAIDPNGQHIINYCVKRFPEEYTKVLLSDITDNCYKIATTKSGCCVIQSCVENSFGEARQSLIVEIIENVVQLAEDPYGNYVVQHLLGMKMLDVTKYLMKRFQGRFVSLSCNKYASNVVEKLLYLGEEVYAAIIMELLRSSNASMLLIDPFGNFVIQTALSVSKGEVYDKLVKFIQVNSPSMQSNLYGKKILYWFDKKKSYYA